MGVFDRRNGVILYAYHDNQCKCLLSSELILGAWAKIRLNLVSIGVVDPPPEKVDYELTVKMDFWCNSDAGLERNYEAYGFLGVNIGTLLY